MIEQLKRISSPKEDAMIMLLIFVLHLSSAFLVFVCEVATFSFPLVLKHSLPLPLCPCLETEFGHDKVLLSFLFIWM